MILETLGHACLSLRDNSGQPLWGFGFQIDTLELKYNPLKVKIGKGHDGVSFVLNIPTLALKDALAYGHFGDLGISMFTIIQLNRNFNPKLVFLFLFLIIFHDYHHTIGWNNFIKWIKSSWKNYTWSLPKPNVAIHLEPTPQELVTSQAS